eukprot:g20507.t1
MDPGVWKGDALQQRGHLDILELLKPRVPPSALPWGIARCNHFRLACVLPQLFVRTWCIHSIPAFCEIRVRRASVLRAESADAKRTIAYATILIKVKADTDAKFCTVFREFVGGRPLPKKL